MKPSIGRIVWYVVVSPLGKRGDEESFIIPAMITGIFNLDADKNLYRVNDGVGDGSVMEVELCRFGSMDQLDHRGRIPYSPTLQAGHWSWPTKVN